MCNSLTGDEERALIEEQERKNNNALARFEAFCEKQFGKKLDTSESMVALGNRLIEEKSREAHQALHQERIAQQKKALFIQRTDASIPEEYSLATIKPFNPTQHAICERLQSYVDNFNRVQQAGANIILTGSIGTGKTHLACAVANALLDKGITVHYTTMYGLCLYIKESWSDKTGDSESQRIQKLIDVDLLIIDEVGVQRDSDMPFITEVIDGRFRTHKPSIILSNYSATELQKILTARNYDRLTRKGYQLLELKGQSLRKEVLNYLPNELNP